MTIPSQSSVAASVRRHKESHPWAYCAHPGCLWRTETRKGYSPCRKHNAYATPEARAEQRAAVLMGTDLPRDRDGVLCGHTEFVTTSETRGGWPDDHWTSEGYCEACQWPLTVAMFASGRTDYTVARGSEAERIEAEYRAYTVERAALEVGR